MLTTIITLRSAATMAFACLSVLQIQVHFAVRQRKFIAGTSIGSDLTSRACPLCAVLPVHHPAVNQFNQCRSLICQKGELPANGLAAHLCFHSARLPADMFSCPSMYKCQRHGNSRGSQFQSQGPLTRWCL